MPVCQLVFYSMNLIQKLLGKHKTASTESPKEQALSIGQLYDMIIQALHLIDMAMGVYSALMDVYITADKQIVAVIGQNGKLYKQYFELDNDVLLIGDVEEIEIEQTVQNKTTVYQQKDGRYRWLCIAATTALNRSGELNSKKLYDSFIDHIEKTKEYPILNFYHQPNTRLGIADYAARDDNLYILSGTFDDNKFGLAAAKGIQSKSGYWGNSIEFWPFDGEYIKAKVSLENELNIISYTQGINDAVSILPEKDAACLGTVILASGGTIMNGKIKEELVNLFEGDQELADEFEQTADPLNQEINENMIHQSANNVDEVVDEVVDVEEEEVTDVVLELDETFLPELLGDLNENDQFNEMVQTRVNEIVQPLQQQIQELKAVVESLKQSITTAVETVQNIEQESNDMFEADIPSYLQRGRVTYRARGNQVENVTETRKENKTYASVANSTLGKIKNGD